MVTSKSAEYIQNMYVYSLMTPWESVHNLEISKSWGEFQIGPVFIGIINSFVKILKILILIWGSTAKRRKPVYHYAVYIPHP